MPNVMVGLERCANVSKRGCKGCPFRGATYCTSMLAQGAETMIKDLKEKNNNLVEKQPMVGSKLKRLIEESAETLKRPSENTRTCNIELSAEDGDALSEFLTKALSNSREVVDLNDFPFAPDPVGDGEQQVRRDEGEVDREFTEAVEQCLGRLGEARPDISYLNWCYCPRCVAARRLNRAWSDFSNTFGRCNAEARRDRIVMDFNRRQSSREQPTTESYVAAQAIRELTEPERAQTEQPVRSAFDAYIRRLGRRLGIYNRAEQPTSDPATVRFSRYEPLSTVEARPVFADDLDVRVPTWTIDDVMPSNEPENDTPTETP